MLVGALVISIYNVLILFGIPVVVHQVDTQFVTMRGKVVIILTILTRY